MRAESVDVSGRARKEEGDHPNGPDTTSDKKKPDTFRCLPDRGKMDKKNHSF